MLFSNEDDDDIDFAPANTGGSKLSSLFGGSGKSSGNSNLKYSAPKQPRADRSDSNASVHSSVSDTCDGAKSKGASPPLATQVLIAVPVQAFLFVNGTAQQQGKVMCCILGNIQICSFQVLVYRTKQQHLARLRIQRQSVFNPQPNNYVNFFDDQQQNWSVMFESNQQLNDFLTQIGICRALTSAGAAVTQDLVEGEGPQAKEGDAIQISLSVWTIVDGKKGPNTPESKDSHKLRLSKGPEAWEMHLLDMKIGGRRIVFNINNAKDGNKTILAYECSLFRIRGKNDTSGRNTPQVEVPVVESNQQPVQDPQAQQLVNEQRMAPSPSPRPSKSTLLSRMARVGHALLPPTQASSLGQTDSESEMEEMNQPVRPASHNSSLTGSVEEVEATPAASIQGGRNVGNSPLQHQQHHHQQQQAQPLVIYQSPSWHHPSMIPYNMGGAGNPHTAATAPPPQPSAGTVSDPTLNLIFSESRTQNTELRISVAKMMDKIDTLMNKVEKLDQQNNHPSSTELALLKCISPGNESQSLISTLTNLIAEKEEMSNRLREKDEKIAHANDQICVLLQKNQRLIEEKTAILLERRGEDKHNVGSSFQETLALREDKAALQVQLANAQSRVQELQEEVSQVRQELDCFMKEKATLKEELCHLQQEHVSRNVELFKKDHNYKEEMDNMCGTIEKQKEEIKSLQQQKEDLTTLSIQKEEEKLAKEKELETLKLEKEDLSVQLKERQEKTKERKEYSQLEKENAELAKQLQELKCTEGERASLQKMEEEGILVQNMKDQYDCKVEKLETQVTLLSEKLQEVESSNGMTNTELVNKVKKVMNAVYRQLKSKFEDEELYTGEWVTHLLVTVIRDTTLSLMDDNQTVKKEPASDVRLRDAKGWMETVVEKPEEEEGKGVDNPSLRPENFKFSEKINVSQKEDSCDFTQENTCEESDSLKESSPEEDSHLSEGTRSFLDTGRRPVIDMENTGAKGDGRGSIQSWDSSSRESSVDLVATDLSWKPIPPPPPAFSDDDDDDVFKEH